LAEKNECFIIVVISSKGSFSAVGLARDSTLARSQFDPNAIYCAAAGSSMTAKNHNHPSFRGTAGGARHFVRRRQCAFRSIFRPYK